jgi:hypothetical protein
MAITDINISEQLETSAPSIKYEGNEGPKSPEEQRMAQLKQEYMQYVFEQKDLQEPVMSFEEWYRAVYEASKMGVDAGQQPQPQPQLQPQGEMRQPVAYGGIMDLGGRRRYGKGSWLKKKIRNLIPNEVADVATKAAPFVSMIPGWGPMAGGVMRGLGRFDQRGSISDAFKQGALTYGAGKLGGAGMEKMGLRNAYDPSQSALSQFFNKPTQGSISNLNPFKKSTHMGSGPGATYPTDMHAGTNIAEVATQGGKKVIEETKSPALKLLDKYAIPIMLGSMGLAAATAKPQDMKAAMNRGEGMDIDSIREEVRVALADPTGEKWEVLQAKYPYMGEQATKKAAEGGIMRAGFYAGGQSIPSDYTMEDAMMTTTQDKLGGITDVMKQADLNRQGSVGQFYAAQGGRIGYGDGGNVFELLQKELEGTITPEELKLLEQLIKERGKDSLPFAQGGRIGAQEGGLMDLGGMEKDYRNDGGFVPIGGKEKADDVPARLSKNEFVFTADAVRGAGGGDIDKGAGIMENVMKNLEQGGQISEESQGLSGAQEMFDVSERLSEVV